MTSRWVNARTKRELEIKLQPDLHVDTVDPLITGVDQVKITLRYNLDTNACLFDSSRSFGAILPKEEPGSGDK